MRIGFLGKNNVTAVVLICLLFFSGCGGSSPDNAVTSPNAVSSPIVIEYDTQARNTIIKAVSAYLGSDCKPKKEDKGFWISENAYPGYQYGFELETDLERVKESYFLDKDSDEFYGNFATRTLFLNSLYHHKLSNLYVDIYDFYESEMRSYKSDFKIYRRIADNSAKKLCNLVELNLRNQSINLVDQQKVQDVYDGLVANWSGFLEWYEVVTKVADEISEKNAREVKDIFTPKCAEYPTADGKYVIVKCTIPPG